MIRLTIGRGPIIVVAIATLLSSCGEDLPRDFVRPPADSYTARSFQLTSAGQTETVQGAEVTPAFFQIAKVSPLLGRSLIAEDSRPNGPAVVMLHHELWSKAFKRDPAVIGTLIQIDGRPHTVVGVMPSYFNVPAGARIWTGRQP